jgi:hypothetical protein
VVAMVQASFLAALVARVGGPARPRPPLVTAPRAVKLATEVPTTDEEDAPAKAATKLIQRLGVFHPLRERKETGRLITAILSSRFVGPSAPDRGPKAATLGPHLPHRAAALYADAGAAANFATASFPATPRRSDFTGSEWPTTAVTRNELAVHDRV